MSKFFHFLLTTFILFILAWTGISPASAQANCRPFSTTVDVPCTPALPYRCTITDNTNTNKSTCCANAQSCTTLKSAQAKSGNVTYPTGTCGEGAIDTALGCIPYETEGFTKSLLTFLAGTAGAIALVVMLIATIQIMTGGDNAEQVKKGKELFTGAVTGLLFIIFSVTLLRIVAGDIIKLPGFTP